MIRAKAVSKKEVDSGNDIYGNPIKRIQYEIKQIKVPVTVLGLLCPAELREVWEHGRVSRTSRPLELVRPRQGLGADSEEQGHQTAGRSEFP